MQPYHSSPLFPLPCIAACLCLNASANPPAILPLLSRAPPLSTPLPLYPLSLAGSGAGLRPTGRLVGGAGGFGFPLAGRAGGAGGGGGLCAISSRYAEGTQPETDLSRREASHQPSWGVSSCVVRRQGMRLLTVVFLLRDQDYLVLAHAQLAGRLSRKVVQRLERWLLRRRRRGRRARRRRRRWRNSTAR
jgi:hypothetical protein